MALPGPKIGLLACSVLEREIALLASETSNIVETRFFEMGLHDRSDQLRETLQAAIDSIDARDDIDAIALAYGLCGFGTAGLCARHHKLVIPRAHDCITVFMGTKERYAGQQAKCPSCYYYTPGWNRERRVPGPDRLESLREELSKRFDEEDVEFLLEAEREQWALHDTVVYLDLGTDDAESEAEYARKCADWLGWRYERIRGDRALLHDLLTGPWDPDRFQIIEPGSKLVHSVDHIMRQEPVDGKMEGQ